MTWLGVFLAGLWAGAAVGVCVGGLLAANRRAELERQLAERERHQPPDPPAPTTPAQIAADAVATAHRFRDVVDANYGTDPREWPQPQAGDDGQVT